MITTHLSAIDRSANIVEPLGPGEAIESRYVERPGRVILYLSSETACVQACRMCWLTQTGQNRGRPVTREEYLDQLNRLIDHMCRESGFDDPGVIHVNFMARGEPLANPNLDGRMLRVLEKELRRAGYPGVVRFLVSTIFPQGTPIELLPRFAILQPTICYSVYSLDPAFRRRWLPRASDPAEAFDELARYQRITGAPVKVHHALIDSENDDPAMAREIATELRRRKIKADFNLVALNPPPGSRFVESDDEARSEYLSTMRAAMQFSHVQEIARVGQDVHASCGMFVR